jgi:hypothetical protein
MGIDETRHNELPACIDSLGPLSNLVTFRDNPADPSILDENGMTVKNLGRLPERNQRSIFNDK